MLYRGCQKNVPLLEHLYGKGYKIFSRRYQANRNDLRRITGAHGRPPGADAAGGVDAEIAMVTQPVIITLIDQSGQKAEREDLAGMAVTG